MYLSSLNPNFHEPPLSVFSWHIKANQLYCILKNQKKDRKKET